MTRQLVPATASHGTRSKVPLLVLTVIAGLVAMHGLGLGAATRSAAGMAGPERTASMHSAMTAKGCGPVDHGGHSSHADATCKANGISSGPTLPAVLSAWTSSAMHTAVPRQIPSTATRVRDPPSLSELQVLVI
ncbi:MAG: hypothetical protein GEV10_17480 [Streptosporangiales bacterium]|nr:hypothetical protein [Streptosporangiales bacterium]